MVLYFSGTGNSHYVAKIIAEKTNDVVVSINQLMKQESKDKLTSTNKPFVFVCPTYAWRIPRVVDKFIRESCFEGSNKAYFIMTCGDDTGNATGYIKQLCKVKEFQLQGFAEVIMPENYITMYKAPEKAIADEIIQRGTFKANQLAENISQETVLPVFIPKSKIKSAIINEAFYKLIVTAKGFYATEKCVGCSKCAQLCPLNNIQMQGKKPLWKNQCTHCMACISGCPTAAIEYKNKTQKKTRYFLECE